MAAGAQTGARRRRFIGLDLPEPWRPVISGVVGELASRVPGLRLVDARDAHVTVAFLGAVDDAAAAEARALMQEAVDTVPGPARWQLGAPRRFGTRVLWLEARFTDQAAFDALASHVRTGLGERGLLDDPQPLRPHVTLARAGRTGVDDHVLSVVADHLATMPRPTQVEGASVTLFAADGTPPPRYARERSLSWPRRVDRPPAAEASGADRSGCPDG